VGMLNKNFSNRSLYGVFLSGALNVLDRPLYIDGFKDFHVKI